MGTVREHYHSFTTLFYFLFFVAEEHTYCNRPEMMRGPFYCLTVPQMASVHCQTTPRRIKVFSCIFLSPFFLSLWRWIILAPNENVCFLVLFQKDDTNTECPWAFSCLSLFLSCSFFPLLRRSSPLSFSSVCCRTLQTVGPSHARTYTVAVYFKGERIGCGKGPRYVDPPIRPS